MLAVVCTVSAARAAESAADGAPRRAVVIYGDRDNGFELTTLLIEAGLDCKPVPYPSVDADWSTDVDLVVAAPCCPGGWRLDTHWNSSLLDRVGEARVLACGDTGAALLATKKLVVGHPWGFHAGATTASFSGEALREPAVEMLRTPHNLAPKSGDAFSVQIQSNLVPVTSIGIYDFGKFRPGTVGIARIDHERHHWLICQQGNFLLWGAGTLAANMTDQARLLFANVAWHLAHAQPAPLIFPDRQSVLESDSNSMPSGSSRLYVHPVERAGQVTLRLHPLSGEAMTLIIQSPLERRLDGDALMEATFRVDEATIGQEIEFEIRSNGTSPDKTCDYLVDVQWSDPAP
jgi:hypothetical protein